MAGGTLSSASEMVCLDVMCYAQWESVNLHFTFYNYQFSIFLGCGYRWVKSRLTCPALDGSLNFNNKCRVLAFRFQCVFCGSPGETALLVVDRDFDSEPEPEPDFDNY
jgi:hypothetical protein